MAEHLLTSLPENQQQDDPERTGFSCRTERYCRGPDRALARAESRPAGFIATAGLRWWRRNRRRNRRRISVKLTDTQLVLLSAASQRDDRALERPIEPDRRRCRQGRRQAPDRGPHRRNPIPRLAAGVAPRRGWRALPAHHQEGPSRRSGSTTRQRSGRRHGKETARPISEIAQGSQARQTCPTSRRFQAGQRHRAAEPPPRGDDRGDHEGDGVAAALGARLLRGRRCARSWG